MSQLTQQSATGGAPDSPLVAGLDLLTERERHADELILTFVAALHARGGSGITAATHWARIGELRHITLSVESASLKSDVFWEALWDTASAASQDTTGVILGEGYVGPPAWRHLVENAVAAHTGRSGGRAVIFPGSATLTGLVSVAELLDTSAIDRVRVLAGGEVNPATVINTRGFLRPRWSDGELILDTQPASGGTLVPFETPSPTPCCAAHV